MKIADEMLFSAANEASTDLWQSLYHEEATVSQQPIHDNTQMTEFCHPVGMVYTCTEIAKKLITSMLKEIVTCTNLYSKAMLTCYTLGFTAHILPIHFLTIIIL